MESIDTCYKLYKTPGVLKKQAGQLILVLLNLFLLVPIEGFKIPVIQDRKKFFPLNRGVDYATALKFMLLQCR